MYKNLLARGYDKEVFDFDEIDEAHRSDYTNFYFFVAHLEGRDNSEGWVAVHRRLHPGMYDSLRKIREFEDIPLISSEGRNYQTALRIMREYADNFGDMRRIDKNSLPTDINDAES